ncbi:MAG TPA: patatin-like phospholipase family protein [Sedimentibacter sp.]|jgi:NTE family protein|nr:patatin-like phospholipase family protein [Sedimentibacter sp.]HHZ01211.1 patatin-like phospholipase family protein [Tissierellia bacterium]HOK49282.1 patatin-like phospholipase family protein [Sedimentibacter sp.]HRC79841.1 patatin-like phospholipase family protein [Sedimentibacter sp.]
MYGLVLEGGGAKGAYHVGAYKALRELNIEIGGIAGTSIGAINGAMMVQGDYDLLEKIWYSVNSYELFDLDPKAITDLKNFNLHDINFSYLLHQSKEILNNRGLDTSRIRELFDSYIDEDKIRNSNIDFGIVTVNLTDKKPMELMKEDIPKGKLIDFLIASANLPAFKIEEVDGKKYLDGGFYNNLPIDILANKGYKDIIAVRTLALGVVRKVRKKDLNITYIQPVESLGSMLGALDFNKEKAMELINLGYYDTMKVFKKLKGYKYYIVPYEGNFINRLVDFYNEYKERLYYIGHLLGYDKVSEDRMFFEKVLPRLESILDMKGENDYQDIAIRFFEKIAEKYGLERFKIYKAEEFYHETIERFRENPTAFIKRVPDFIKHNRILSLAVKDDLLVEIFAELFI